MALLSLALLPFALVLPPTLHPCAQPAAHVSRTGSAARMADSWDSNDQEALENAIRKCHSSTRLGEPGYALQGLPAAYVLIFNPGQPDEGVYTLQGAVTKVSSYVLSFEATEDADRFAELLQAEGFDLATAVRWEVGQLEAFCQAGAFEVSLVPSGSLLTPPAKNEFDVDAFRKLSGDYVEEEEEEDLLDAYAQERARLERLFRQ